MSLFPITAPPPPSVIVTLSGWSVSTIRIYPGTADAGLKVGADGNIYERRNFGAWNQVCPGTDWVRPASAAADGLYEVRYTNLTGDPLDFATRAQNTWFTLSTGDFTLLQQRSDVLTDQSDFDLEIRHNGGPVLATAAYTLKATVDV